MEHFNPKEWNQRILAHPEGSFLQSFEWGEFQTSLGRPVRRTVISGRIPIQSVRMALPIGVSYELISRGPAGEDASAAELATMLHELGQDAGALFVRFEPPWPADRTGELAAAGFRRTAPVQPETTWVLNLGVPEAELLAAMHPKTRYNIRVAERHGVRVVEAGFERYPEFWRLLSGTADRGGFRTHGKQYHTCMAERFLVADMPPAPCAKPQARLFFAEYQGEGIAAALVLFFNREAAYLYGGSADRHREVMAPHLLHREIIRRVKALGYQRYNFWGIAPRSGAMRGETTPRSGVSEAIGSPHDQARRASGGATLGETTSRIDVRGAIDDPHGQARMHLAPRSDAGHPWQNEQMKQWAGFTRFKRGFGGAALAYVGAWDLLLRPAAYRLYSLARTIRRVIGIYERH